MVRLIRHSQTGQWWSNTTIGGWTEDRAKATVITQQAFMTVSLPLWGQYVVEAVAEEDALAERAGVSPMNVW